MTNKLTLSRDNGTVKKTKRYARQRNLNLSNERNMPVSSITQELTGMVKTSDIKERRILADALTKKYL